MKIAITGATGFVGQQLVPQLSGLGYDLLLVGRDVEKLMAIFPGITTCTYGDLSQGAKGFDLLLHLAVLNNSASAPLTDFMAVNVDLFEQVLDAACKAGVGRVLNVTTTHAFDETRSDPYSVSKRAALAAASQETRIAVTSIVLPAVYGRTYAGRMSILNKFPAPLRGIGRVLLTALVPAVNVRHIAEFVSTCTPAHMESIVFINDPQDRNPVFRAGKLLIDLAFAFAVIGLLWWALLFVWVLVRTGSAGPGIFAQERVGRGGKIFVCYKFRTMQQGTVQAGTHEVSAASVTKIGGFLRKTKIDELPQVWNMLRREISLIGPRPCLPVQKELIAERQARGVNDILPGISGLAQVNGIDMSNPKVLAQWDQRYVAQRGLLLDIKIILRTFLGGGQGDKVARN